MVIALGRWDSLSLGPPYPEPTLRGIRDRQFDAGECAALRARGEFQRSFEAFDDGAGEEEPEPHPLADFLGGEERFAGAGENAGVHAVAQVADFNDDPAAVARDLHFD